MKANNRFAPSAAFLALPAAAQAAILTKLAAGNAKELAGLRVSTEADLAAAAGPLLVPIPAPGSNMARLLSANVILRRQNARGNALANAARAWSVMVRRALAAFPELTASPEALALMQASAELDAGLGPLPPRLELSPRTRESNCGREPESPNANYDRRPR